MTQRDDERGEDNRYHSTLREEIHLHDVAHDRYENMVSIRNDAVRIILNSTIDTDEYNVPYTLRNRSDIVKLFLQHSQLELSPLNDRKTLAHNI